MRGVLCAAAGAVILTGCGYIGDPQPPALRRPMMVTDLTAVQTGSNLIIQFTIPRATTEDLPLRGNEDIELRAGPEADNQPDWLKTSERERVRATGDQAHVEVPAAKWYGKTVDIAVNVHGPTGHSLGWSRFFTVQVVPALPRPEAVAASNAPDAVHLEWRAGAPEFRVFRKLPDQTDWGPPIGTSMRPSYTDGTIEYGKTYDYMVQSIEKNGETYTESERSDPIAFKPVDMFPPAVPTGLSAVPGSRSIELVWERNTEKDFQSYRVYRDGKLIAGGLTGPVFSDRDVKPGTKYKYEVSALDNAGNESARSAPAEAVIP